MNLIVLVFLRDHLKHTHYEREIKTETYADWVSYAHLGVPFLTIRLNWFIIVSGRSGSK